MQTSIISKNLPFDTEENEVYELFEPFGKITSLKLYKGFVFLDFENHSDAECAVTNRDSYTFRGNKLVVEFVDDAKYRDSILCFLCKKKGHREIQCPKNTTKEKDLKGGICFVCGRCGHIAKHCKLKKLDGDLHQIRDPHEYHDRSSRRADDRHRTHNDKLASKEIYPSDNHRHSSRRSPEGHHRHPEEKHRSSHRSSDDRHRHLEEKHRSSHHSSNDRHRHLEENYRNPHRSYDDRHRHPEEKHRESRHNDYRYDPHYKRHETSRYDRRSRSPIPNTRYDYRAKSTDIKNYEKDKHYDSRRESLYKEDIRCRDRTRSRSPHYSTKNHYRTSRYDVYRR